MSRPEPLPPLPGYDAPALMAPDPVQPSAVSQPAQSVNQPTAHTTDKVTAASVGAAIIALLVAVLTQYGFEVDAVTASALTPFAVWFAGWMMKERIR